MRLRRTILLLPLVLAACGGGTATSAPTGTTPTTGATEAPPATQPGGATTTDWCLNSPPEVEAALHVMGVVATGSDTPGVGGGCLYTLADGTMVHAVSVVTSQGYEATFESGKQTPGVVEISGIGNGAILMSALGPLVILTDSGLISMGPTGPDDIMADPAKYRTAVEELGRAAVARMP